MSFKKQELTSLHTMKLSSVAENFCEVKSVQALTEALNAASEHALAVSILGGGSNTLFCEHVQTAIIKLRLMGIETKSESDEYVELTVGASEDWHDFVEYTVKAGMYGLENLALIPGTVGAAPVQNIGAYGVEVAEYIEELEVFDIKTHQILKLQPDQCNFAYRESNFKGKWKGKYVILNVTFRLSKRPKLLLSYFAEAQRSSLISPRAVFQHVIATRSAKLPDPKLLANSGSFFKNPIVDTQTAQSILNKYPNVPHWSVGEGIKFAAGWMIDRVGLRGQLLTSTIGTYEHQALVMVNHGTADCSQLLEAQQTVVDAVEHEFGIKLEREPVLVE